ncbi:hypothetical protein Bhyg_02814 [Pseudolycoriella hygida]|uniref:Uncharacterized protein n=1 Tax=Pseudolycoriella hygida TaxID=35572 RepID=A0A9Q0NC57_9DIPT|nr:hypothetical protein Bhyg_02814 [Pseudolycoriella hygida]
MIVQISSAATVSTTNFVFSIECYEQLRWQLKGFTYHKSNTTKYISQQCWLKKSSHSIPFNNQIKNYLGVVSSSGYCAIKMTTNKLPNFPLVIAFVLLLPMQITNAHIMEIILEEDSPAVPAILSNANNLEGFDENGGNGIGTSGCSVEFQVMKKFPGRCVRLGKNGGHGCVSGNHIIPFHPDCL